MVKFFGVLGDLGKLIKAQFITRPKTAAAILGFGFAPLPLKVIIGGGILGGSITSPTFRKEVFGVIKTPFTVGAELGKAREIIKIKKEQKELASQGIPFTPADPLQIAEALQKIRIKKALVLGGGILGGAAIAGAGILAVKKLKTVVPTLPKKVVPTAPIPLSPAPADPLGTVKEEKVLDVKPMIQKVPSFTNIIQIQNLIR